MDNSRYSWRKTKEENSYHYVQKGVIGSKSKPRSQNYRRPSFGYQSSLWEKKFCATAGVPWKKLLETKKYMYMDQNQKILQWNDSAVQEAFWNAKTQFYAQMHGQQCDIKLPDPDIFIDKIDWDSDNVDPQLILDLDNKGEPETRFDNKDGGVVLGIPVVPEQYLSTPNGWGDVEEEEEPTKDSEIKLEVINEKEKDCLMGNLEDNCGYYVPKNRNHYKDFEISRYKISRFEDNGNYCNCGSSFVDHEYGVKKGNFGNKRTQIKWVPVARQW